MSAETKVYVVFYNPDIGGGVRTSHVEGRSGKKYKAASFQTDGTHVSLPFTLEEYAKAIDDISRGWRRPLCRWIPMFVEAVGEEAPRGQEVSEGGDGANTANGLDGDELSRMPFFSLKKMAREKGVNPEGMKKPEIIEALLVEK